MARLAHSHCRQQFYLRRFVDDFRCQRRARLKREYVLELTESEVVLVIIDRYAKKKTTQMLLLDDVIYAEYYPYPDSSTIIYHTEYALMEVPLWPMGDRGQDVVDFTEGRGVRVINVQSDESIPA